MPRPKGSRNSKPKPHSERTPTQIEADRAFIQEKDLLGWSQTRIAREMGRSQALVSMELKNIREAYNKAYVDDRKALVMRETAVLLRVRAEAFEQLERLKKGKTKKRSESGSNDKGGWAKDVEEQEDVEYSGVLSVIIDTEREIAKLWGLVELPKVTFNVDARSQTVNFFDDVLLGALGIKKAPAVEDEQEEEEEPT